MEDQIIATDRDKTCQDCLWSKAGVELEIIYCMHPKRISTAITHAPEHCEYVEWS